MWKRVFVLFSVFFMIQAQFDVGDPCALGENDAGVCEYLYNCEYADNKIHVEKTKKGVQFCGWEGKISIVCCPQNGQNLRIGRLRALFANGVDSITSDDIVRYKNQQRLQ